MSGSARAGLAGDGRSADATVTALQQALAAEQAASYGYGVVGAQLTGRALAAATADWIAHQRIRDQLGQLLIARGAVPRPAAVAYRLPVRVTTATEAVALAALIEDRVAAAYLGLVALGDRGLRGLGAELLRDGALRAARWRGRTIAFPGLPAGRL